MDILECDLQWQIKRYKQLIEITETLHSSLDVENLLGELCVIFKELYPDSSFSLLLSQDTYSHNELPIIELEYDSENIAAIKAYGSGELQFEYSATCDHTIIYAPLKGKRIVKTFILKKLIILDLKGFKCKKLATPVKLG
ncbi:hypothetical protein ACE198_27165 [Neobacillus sp. KR4-4]|uniref:hypothetical protein n=1 Tax=Neobacillus sp. KR4-4 TaxID=3344872 RepID=UPI0035CB933E